MVSRASQRGRVLLKRSACQHSRPPIKGISTSQGRIMTGSFPYVNSWSGYREQEDTEHQHGTAGDGGGVPADLPVLGAAEQGVATPGQQGNQANGAIQRIAPQDACQPEIGLHEYLVIYPVEAPGSEPPGAQETPGCALADSRNHLPLPQIEPGCQQDAGYRDNARRHFETETALATGMAGAGRQYARQWRGDPGADKGREDDQRKQRQVMRQSLARMGIRLRLAVEHHEDQAEGVDGSQERTHQPCVQQRR